MDTINALKQKAREVSCLTQEETLWSLFDSYNQTFCGSGSEG